MHSFAVLDPETGELERLDLPFTASDAARRARTEPLRGRRRDADRAGRDRPSSMRTAGDLRDGCGAASVELRSGVDLGRAGRSSSQSARAPIAHALLLPARERRLRGAAGGASRRLRVVIHGGPTSQAKLALPDVPIQFLTTRGLGRRRRQLRRLHRLRPRVPRAAAAANGASSTSRTASPQRAISRTPARWTASACRSRAAAPAATRRCWRLPRSDVFAAGISAFGVADLVTFAETTHKFEARYLDWLLGAAPGSARRLPRPLADRRTPTQIRAAGADRAGARRQGRADRAGGGRSSKRSSGTAFRTSTCRSRARGTGSGGASRAIRMLSLLRLVLRPGLRLRARGRRRAARDRRALGHGVAELTRNAVDVLPEGALEAKLKLGRPLRIKLGIDPTSPDLHLGFAFALENLRRVPGGGPRDRPHRRRLHGADRRPVGPLGGAAGPRRRGARREREASSSSRRTGSSTRSARPSASTASGSASSPTRRPCACAGR